MRRDDIDLELNEIEDNIGFPFNTGTSESVLLRYIYMQVTGKRSDPSSVTCTDEEVNDDGCFPYMSFYYSMSDYSVSYKKNY